MSVYMPLDCDGFAAELADYLEGDAPDAVRTAVESHAAECAACRQLLEDLRSIRHDAAALPALVPSRDLWDGIAERIDARVIPMETSVRTIQPARRSWARPAIAAAALVIVTAGITHELTRASLRDSSAAGGSSSSQRITSVATTSTPAIGIPESTATSTSPATSQSVSGAGQTESTQPERSTRSSNPRAQLASSTTRLRPAPVRASTAVPLMKETEPVYDREIDKLHRIVKTRRAQLDPKTIAVLEQSIAVIDSAIAQSRSALAKDPASGFLANQLNHSLEKKVELLRTAAMLPART